MPAAPALHLNANPASDDRVQSGHCGGGQQTPDQEERAVEQTRTPLPVGQIFVLCLMRFAEPISFSVIFPFVNQMIEEIGITNDPKAIGYYSGMVEGVFSLAQFCTVCYWGSLSDRIGRRPVLIFGLCGVVGSTILFGMSTSFTTMILSRILSGALNGNAAVIKSVLGEITDKTNAGAAFVYLPLCWSIGALIAPALGGFLSHPVERYPLIFGSFSLFRHYPYLLPCLAGSALSTIGLIAGWLFLEESLPEKKSKPTLSVDLERRPLLSDIRSNNEEPAPSIWEILRTPAVGRVLVSYAFMAFETVSVSAVFVLWLYTPVSLGGMGFSSAEIGGALVLSGILGTLIAAVIFPPLERRLGVTVLFKAGMMLQVMSVLAFPLGNAIAKAGGKRGAYIGAGVMLSVNSVAGIVFVCNMLLINRSAPSRHALGTVNGLAQMVASASRAVGPAFATSLFAFSIENSILAGNLVWLVLAAVAVIGAVVALRLPSDRPERNAGSVSSS